MSWRQPNTFHHRLREARLWKCCGRTTREGARGVGMPLKGQRMSEGQKRCKGCDKQLYSGGHCRGCVQRDISVPSRGRSRSRILRKAQSLRMLGNKHLLGHKHSDETKHKMSIAHKGKRINRTKGVLHTEEWKAACSKWMKGNRNGEGGRGKPGKPHTQAWIRKALKWLRGGGGETGIEKKVRLILEQEHIRYYPEKKFKDVGYVDFYLTEQHKVIECDGVYWHRTEEAKVNDRRRDRALLRMGITVLRLPEKLINGRAEPVRQRILQFMQGG